MVAAEAEAADGEAGISFSYAYAACGDDCARFALLGPDTEEEKRLGSDTEEEKRLGSDTEEEKRLALDMWMEKRKARLREKEKRVVLAETEKGVVLAETEKVKRLALETEKVKRLALETEKEKRLALAMEKHLREKGKPSKKYWRRPRFEQGARPKADMAVEHHREQGAGRGGEDGRPDLEPLFDEAAYRKLRREVAERERSMQKEQQRQELEAHYIKLESAREAALERIRDYDLKTGKNYYYRVEDVDNIATFDYDEESPLGPMRDTEALIYAYGPVASDDGEKKFIASDTRNLHCINVTASNDGEKKFIASDTANLHSIDVTSFSDASSKDSDMRFVLDCSANVFSIKMVSSDVGFPIEVYGTVIARDDIDLKCVYLFRRDRDDCQLILSKDESLVLTGPKRGLALKYHLYFEFDLKIKCVGRQNYKPLSKGYLAWDGIRYRSWRELEVERAILDTKLSKVMITLAVVQRAVEATFAIEVLQGRFYGEITAHTTGIPDSMVLHDSKMVEAMTNNGKGVIQLFQNVVAVDLRKKLMCTIVARTCDGKAKSTTIRFTPGVIGREEKEITCGSVKMCVKVTWSIVSRRYYQPSAYSFT